MKATNMFFKVLSIMALLAVLASCAPAASSPTSAPAPTNAPAAPATSAPTNAPAAPATAAPTVAPASPTMGQAQDIVTWWEFDQNNTDPKADEHVGNAALREAIPLFNQQFAGKWNWVNNPVAFDQKDAQLITAVQAGGQVPDAFEVTLGVTSFYQHGTLQDLTDWAKAQPWYSDLDPNVLSVCTGPDGKLYCVPMTERPQVVYVWKDLYPNGLPTSVDDFMTQAAALKANDHYALTFFGSTDNNGESITRAYDTVLQSFGGAVDDGHGKMLLNTPQDIAAIQFLRDIVAKGYVPDIAFAGGFQEESAFTNSSAGAFPTGADGYTFLNPLTAPSGKKYEKGNQNDFLDAVAAGDIYVSPFFSAVSGQKPGCNIFSTGIGIPVGAKNVDGAKAYINWLMSAEENSQFVFGIGAMPALKTSQANQLFQIPYFEQLAKVSTEEACKPWYGTLEDPAAAQPIVATVFYQLIKQNPSSDIASALDAAAAQYNSNH
jgi:ABC-type glycerol-3-phosphate transport system substrate-binding protein